MLSVKAKWRTFRQILDEAIGFHRPSLRNDHHLFTAFAESTKRFDAIAGGLQTIFRDHLECTFVPPRIQTTGAEVAAMPFEEAYQEMKKRVGIGLDALAKSVSKPEVGRIEFTDGESGRYTYFEIQRVNELTGTVIRRIAHTNHVVRAKLHRLPAAHIPKPALAERIIRAIPAPLQPHVRIVTGTEVVSETKLVNERKELNWLGKLRQMAAPDPAIVIGEVCLFGWE